MTLDWVDALEAQFRRIIVGQKPLFRRLIQALITGNHVLIEGLPGLGKTLTVVTIARSLNATFKRIQFTPDLLPADVTGTQIYDVRTGEFTPRLGPICANSVLADEINRAPAKVQSALLEAMQERHVTIGGQSFDLPSPFLVLATQNPIELEGTYGLPEAQLDRFLFKLSLHYPEIEDERAILDRMACAHPPTEAEPVAHAADVLRSRDLLDEIHMEPQLRDYIVSVIDATRHPAKYGIKLERIVRYGASPRAAIFLAMASKAEALLSRRNYVTPQDVKNVAADVLRHRVLLTYEADAESITTDQVIEQTLAAVPVP